MVKRPSLVCAVLPALALSLPALAATHTHHSSAKFYAAASHTVSKHSMSSHAVSAHGRRAVRIVAVHHESAAMDSGRATEIQAALVRAGYLSGEPSGVWDSASIAAMQKLQDDNGWQTKYTPDSRALAKLGLGPAPLPPSPPTGTAVATEQAQATSVSQP